MKCLVILIMFFLFWGCDREIKEQIQVDIDSDEQTADDSGCENFEIDPAPPVKPVLPDVSEVQEYSGDYDNCKDLPQIKDALLILGEGCFKGCVSAAKKLEISGAGSDKTIIVCDDPEKNGVIEVQPYSEVIMRNLSISGKTRGVFVNNNSKLQIENSVIFNVTKGGINVCGGESTCQSEVTVTGSKISNVIPDAQSNVSYGISMGPGKLVVENSILRGFNSFAVSLWGETSGKIVADVNNVVISDIYGGKTDFEGTAIYSEGSLEVSIKKVLIKNVSVSFIYISAQDPAERSTVTLEDVTAENITVSQKEQGGLIFDGNIDAELKKIEIINSLGYGIFSKGAGVKAVDVTISGVSPDMTDENGFGMALFDGSSSTFSRLDIRNATTAGILMDGKCSGVINDFVISDTRSDSRGEFGIGVAVQESAGIIMNNGVMDSNRESGFMAVNGKVELRNVKISSTKQRKCNESGECGFAPGIPFGHGISLYQNSQLVFGNISIFNNRNGMNIENSKIYQKNEGSAFFVKNVSAVNAWNVEQFQILEDALVNSEFCDNGSIFTTDIQPVREGF